MSTNEHYTATVNSCVKMVTQILPILLFSSILCVSQSLGQNYAPQTQHVIQNKINPTTFLQDILSTPNGQRAYKLLQLIKAGVLNPGQNYGNAVEINRPCNRLQEYLPISPNIPNGQYIQNGECLRNQVAPVNPLVSDIIHQYKNVCPNSAGVNVLSRNYLPNAQVIPKCPNQIPSQTVAPNPKILVRNPPSCHCGYQNKVFNSILPVSSPVSHVVGNDCCNLPPVISNSRCSHLRKIPIPPPTL